MYREIFALVLASTFFTGECYWRNIYPTWEPKLVEGEVGEPLILTPYLESGDFQTAQNLSRVVDFSEVESYSGYFTVNKEFNSNLFFWFFPAEKDPENAPVLLWLQGGPGSSSTYGLFMENGPFFVNADLTLSPREYSWTKVFSMLYIDNPAGTGFSFTDSEEGYARNETQVGVDLYAALQQFFTLFPNLQDNGFYVTGESYAGKYVPAIAYRINLENPSAELRINMKGVVIGNGLSDPVSMMNYSALLYQIGLLDMNARDYFQEKEHQIIDLINAESYNEAYQILDELIMGDLTPYATYFYNQTHFHQYFNYLRANSDDNENNHVELIQQENSRIALHVGNTSLGNGALVERYLYDDMLRSVKPWIEELLENYSILFYNGQMDIIVAYVHTEEFLQTLNWSGAQAFRNASRQIWRSADDDVAGYRKSAGFLTEVIVRNAGHMVPTDQPQRAFELISDFVNSIEGSR